jgi:FkbM family methyltransferase
VIVFTKKEREILQNANINNIIRLQMTDHLQYFDRDIVLPDMAKTYSFIDVGAADLTSSRLFIEWCEGRYDKVIAFEPDIHAFDICESARLKNDVLRDVTLLNEGLHSGDATLYFEDSNVAGIGSSRIADKTSGTVEIRTTSIDNILKGKEISFIKLDVEGAEMEALRGAVNTITAYTPIFCVYHKPEDIIEVPLYILEQCSDYRFYLRHHNDSYIGTVLYGEIQ